MTLLRGRVAVAPWGMIAKGLERSIIDCQRRLDVLTQFDPKTGARGRSAKAALDIAQKAM